MKRFGLFHKSFILLVCLLLFGFSTPAFGGEVVAPDSATYTVAVDDGGDVLASPFVYTVADYEQGFKYIGGLDSGGYISPASYKAPFIVQHRSGIASARYGETKARDPDHTLISASLKGKELIKSGSHFDRLRPGPLITT